MNKLNRLEQWMIWLSGHDKKTAEQCTTSEIRKMTIAGSIVMIPPMVALFSYGYALFCIFKSVAVAAIGGFVSAIALLIIDRSIMAYGRPGVFSFGMAGRVLLALTVGFMLAEPVILKVFEDSITEHQFQEVTDAKEQIANPFDEREADIANSLKEDEGKLFALQQAYTMEMDGTGGSRIRNQGPIYRKKFQDYQDFKKQFDARRRNAESDIAAVRAQKAKALEQVVEKKSDGLMGRMRTLQNLGTSEPVVMWTTWLLRLFFVLIELLPLLIKISPTNDNGLYYKLVDTLDREREAIVFALSKEREKIIVKEEQLRYALQYAQLCEQEVTNIAKSKGSDTVNLMDHILMMAEKKMQFKVRAAKRITNEQLLHGIYVQIDQIFDGFFQTIEQLNNRSNDNFSSENI